MPSSRDIEPPASEPGHHPDHEQDKPLDRRPRPRSVVGEPDPVVDSEARPAGAQRFEFKFDGVVGTAARAAVIHADRAYVEIAEGELVARYGPWVVRTPTSNVTAASITGPYEWWKVAGPPHLSFSDKGLTFATNADRGVCISFDQPVAGIEFTGRIRHPGLTVTVDDVHGLIAALNA